ncbi:MAG: hypothetical protein ABJB47_19755 [Actinomycetota bacterium]
MIRPPLPIDVKLMADVYDAMSVLLDTVTSLRIGGTIRGALSVGRTGPGQPFALRPGEHSEKASQEQLQDLVLTELATAAQQTGHTSHLTAVELHQLISNVPDLISATDKANLKILEDAAKPVDERRRSTDVERLAGRPRSRRASRDPCRTQP